MYMLIYYFISICGAAASTEYGLDLGGILHHTWVFVSRIPGSNTNKMDDQL